MISITILVLPPKRPEDDPRYVYRLACQPEVEVITTKANGLNKLCRKLVALGATGPAEVRDASGLLRFSLKRVEETARWDLYESDKRGFYWQHYRPYPMADPRSTPTGGASEAALGDGTAKAPPDSRSPQDAVTVGKD